MVSFNPEVNKDRNTTTQENTVIKKVFLQLSVPPLFVGWLVGFSRQ